MFPKEHGAYGQMIAPLVAALAIARPTTGALSLSLAIVSAFVAHEPLLVLTGRRGPRARREHARRARAWLTAAAAVALVAGAAGVATLPPHAVWTAALPAIPLLVFVAEFARGREKSAVAEVAVALSFSSAALPVARAAGAPLEWAAAVAGVFAAMFMAATLGVRAILLRSRGGGDPRGAYRSRAAAAIVTAAAAAVTAIAVTRAWIPPPAGAAALPGLAVASWIAFSPPPASALRRVGWAIVAASAVTVALLAVGARFLS